MVTESAELGADRLPGIGFVVLLRILLVRLHLLDGTYELFRAHFNPNRDAMPDPEGLDIKATVGIMMSTLAFIREGVTHIAASFDTVIESFRNDMFPAYKSSVGMDPGLLRQFPIAEDALEALGVVVWRNVEFEADDAIATAAIKWVEEVDQVVIATPDKDLCQLVIGDRIVTYNRREQKMLDEDAVVEKFGIRPESIPDYLALVGDTADGVPGLPGWGAKSTAAVLARYPRLELIPPSASDWEVAVRRAEKLALTLASNQDLAFMYRELTTLRFDVPIEETLADLEWQGVPRERFQAFCDKLGPTRRGSGSTVGLSELPRRVCWNPPRRRMNAHNHEADDSRLAPRLRSRDQMAGDTRPDTRRCQAGGSRAEPCALEGWGARLLDLQSDDGLWGGGVYTPKWTSTTYSLLLLRHLGIDPAHDRVRSATDLVRDRLTLGALNWPFFEYSTEVCITGMTLALGSYFLADPGGLRNRSISWRCSGLMVAGIVMSTRTAPHSTPRSRFSKACSSTRGRSAVIRHWRRPGPGPTTTSWSVGSCFRFEPQR